MESFSSSFLVGQVFRNSFYFGYFGSPSRLEFSGEQNLKAKKHPVRYRFGRGACKTCAKVQGLTPKNGVEFGFLRVKSVNMGITT